MGEAEDKKGKGLAQEHAAAPMGRWAEGLVVCGSPLNGPSFESELKKRSGALVPSCRQSPPFFSALITVSMYYFSMFFPARQ